MTRMSTLEPAMQTQPAHACLSPTRITLPAHQLPFLLQSSSLQNPFTDRSTNKRANPLTQMTRQQEIRNPLLDRILVPAIPTHQLPLQDLRLQQQRMQFPEHLLAPFTPTLPIGAFAFGLRLRQRREAKLFSPTPNISALAPPPPRTSEPIAG